MDDPYEEARKLWLIKRDHFRALQVAAGMKEDKKKFRCLKLFMTHGEHVIPDLAFGSTLPRNKWPMPSRQFLQIPPSTNYLITPVKPEDSLGPMSYHRDEVTSMVYQLEKQICSTRGRYFGATLYKQQHMFAFDNSQSSTPGPGTYTKSEYYPGPKLRIGPRREVATPLPKPKVPRFPPKKIPNVPGPGRYQPEYATVGKSLPVEIHLGMGRSVVNKTAFQCYRDELMKLFKCVKCGETPGINYWSAPRKLLPPQNEAEEEKHVTIDRDLAAEKIVCKNCYKILKGDCRNEIFLKNFKHIYGCKDFHWHPPGLPVYRRKATIFKMRDIKNRQPYQYLFLPK